MSTVKVDSIKSSDGNTDLLSVSNGVASGVSFGRRNMIINGDMRIAQRGTSTTWSSGYNSLDRWYIQGTVTSAAATISQERYSGLDGFEWFQRVTVTGTESSVGADNFFTVKQNMEALAFKDQVNFADNTTTNPITVSFWVRSSVTGTFCVTQFFQHNDPPEYGTYINEYTINSANTWEYKTLTFPGFAVGTVREDNYYNNFTQFRFNLMTGANKQDTSGQWNTTNSWGTSNQTNLFATNGATFDLTGVQAEIGEVATPFEYRSYAEELALCQRYYWRKSGLGSVYTGMGSGVASSSTSARVYIDHPVPMRVQPTHSFGGNVVFYMGTTSNYVTSINATFNGFIDITIPSNGVDGRGGILYTYNTANDYLEADAEL
jgi:hypothetical protein